MPPSEFVEEGGGRGKKERGEAEGRERGRYKRGKERSWRSGEGETKDMQAKDLEYGRVF